MPALPADRISAGQKHPLAGRCLRAPASEGQPIIDVLMLNWVELEFPAAAASTPTSSGWCWASRQGASTVVLSSEEPGELLIFDDDGRRWDARSYKKDQRGRHPLRAGGAGKRRRSCIRWRAARSATPAAVEVDRPSRLAAPDNQADYLMIVHPSLKRALEPLAELHRRRGLTVQVVDVRDIYDEYSFGLRRPEAIQAFVADAWHHWKAPRPRFVLLVGDASWDSRGEEVADENYADWTYQPGESFQFIKNGSTPYADAGKKAAT